MGLFQRTAEASSDRFWKLARPVMRAGEQQIDYAHLRCVSGREDFVGTLFLTSEQVIWRVADPRVPRGAGFEVGLVDLIGVGRAEGVTDAGAFALAMTRNGRDGMLLFYPQKPRSRANVGLAEEMFDSLRSAWHLSRS